MKKLTNLSSKKIDKVFENAETQLDYLIKLYQIAIPNWNDVKNIDGFPKVSKTTNVYLFNKAIKFDQEKHPNVMNGGLWLDMGFGCSENLPDWQISLNECKINY